jgi:hypothetical protein
MKRHVGITSITARKYVPLLVGLVLFMLPSIIHAQASETTVKLTVMSKDQLEGASIDRDTNRLHVMGGLRAISSSAENGVYSDLFRLDADYADSIAPASELQKIGVVPSGSATFTLPDGSVGEYSFGLATFEFMGEAKESKVIFGPEGVESILGINALQAIGFTVDPASHSLSRAGGGQ